jgi:hypothetical protein
VSVGVRQCLSALKNAESCSPKGEGLRPGGLS